MGVSQDVALGAVRLSLGRATTASQIDRAIQALTTGYRVAVTRAAAH